MKLHESELPVDLQRLLSSLGKEVRAASLSNLQEVFYGDASLHEALAFLKEPLVEVTKAPQPATLNALRNTVGQVLAAVDYLGSDKDFLRSLLDGFALPDPEGFFSSLFPAEAVEGLLQEYSDSLLEPEDFADVTYSAGRQGISQIEVVPIASPWDFHATGLQKFAVSVMKELCPLFTVKLSGPSCNVSFWSWAHVDGRWRWTGKLRKINRMNPEALRRGSLSELPVLAHWVSPEDCEDGAPSQLLALARALLSAGGEDSYQDLVNLSAETALPTPSAFFHRHFGLEGGTFDDWNPSRLFPDLMRGLAAKGYLEPEVFPIDAEAPDSSTLPAWLALRHIREPLQLYRLCWRGTHGAIDFHMGDWVFSEGHWRMIRDWPEALLLDPSGEAKQRFFQLSFGSPQVFEGNERGLCALGRAISEQHGIQGGGASYLLESITKPVPEEILLETSPTFASLLRDLNEMHHQLGSDLQQQLGQMLGSYSPSAIQSEPAEFLVEKLRATISAETRAESEEVREEMLSRALGPLLSLAEDFPTALLTMHRPRTGEMSELGPFVFLEDGWRFLPMSLLQEFS